MKLAFRPRPKWQIPSNRISVTLPNFIGIGAPKAGTTWLAKCLGEHPNVYMASSKELVYFDIQDVHFKQNLDVYLAHFSDVTHETAIGEFTTRYLASEQPAPRIRAMIPDVRLLVCLRNPVDQVYSHYWHLARQNFHQAEVQGALGFEAALERFPDLLLKPARYWQQLQYWLQHFAAEQLLVLVYDDLVAQPETVLQRTFAFLGVDSTFVPPSTRVRDTSVRQGASPRSHWAGRIHRQLYATLSRHVYLPLKRTIGVRRADGLKRALQVRPLMESLFFRKGYPQLTAATREKLSREFASEVAGIEQFLGRELPTWK